MQLTKTRMQQGVWEGVISGVPTRPKIDVRHLDMPVEAHLAQSGDDWVLHIPIPAAAIADGVQTLVISEAGSGGTLGVITLLAGDVLDEDIRAELALLRAEMDMLKRAFRQHCVETG